MLALVRLTCSRLSPIFLLPASQIAAHPSLLTQHPARLALLLVVFALCYLSDTILLVPSSPPPLSSPSPITAHRGRILPLLLLVFLPHFHDLHHSFTRAAFIPVELLSLHQAILAVFHQPGHFTSTQPPSIAP